MKKKIKIGENPPHPLYISKELAEEGFIGDTYMLANAVTITIVKPETSLKDIIKSLQMVINDAEFRLERGEEIFESKKEDKKEPEDQ